VYVRVVVKYDVFKFTSVIKTIDYLCQKHYFSFNYNSLCILKKVFCAYPEDNCLKVEGNFYVQFEVEFYMTTRYSDITTPLIVTGYQHGSQSV